MGKGNAGIFVNESDDAFHVSAAEALHGARGPNLIDQRHREKECCKQCDDLFHYRESYINIRSYRKNLFGPENDEVGDRRLVCLVARST